MTIWLPILLLFIYNDAANAANICPAGCQCDNNAKSATCAGRGFTKVPQDLPQDTEILRLEGNQITSLSDTSLQNYRQLRTLDISYNRITKISKGAFIANKQLQVLELNGNQLTAPPVDSFDATNHLQELYLGENRITDIRKDTFTKLHNLRVLNLRSNSIRNIPNGAFGALSVLHQLDLSENGLKNMTARQYMGLRSLSILSLTGNKVSFIHENAFQELVHLGKLDLAGNKIAGFDLKALKMLKNLKVLKLERNQIQTFVGLNFTHIPSLEELYLGYNPVRVIQPHLFKFLHKLEILYLNHLPNLEFVDYRTFCGLQSLRIVDLSENPLVTKMDKNLFLPTKNLESINLSLNNFTSFYQEAFVHLENLNTLLLDGNPLECNCAAAWLHNLSISTELPKLSSGIKCAKPNILFDYSISDIPVQNLTCENALIVNHTEHASFKIGSEAVLKCLVSGEPMPSITWITPSKTVFMHNDYLSNGENSDITHEDIAGDDFHSEHHWHDSVHYFHNTSHDRVQILANGDLYIDYVQRIDSGSYICIAKNPGGNESVVIRFRLNYLKFKEIKITSLIIGFGGAGAFFVLGLIVALLRFLCNRCEKKERMARKTRTIRKLLDNLEAYKSHQLDKLKDNYSLQVTKIKEQAVAHMDKMQKNYNMQLQKIRDNCAGQMDKLRENYNTQMGKIKGYSTHQIDKIRENYNSQMIKIRDYGSVQLEKLRDTYKLQHQHLIKILEAMNIDHCRGVMDDGECPDTSIFDQLGLDLLDSKPSSRNSISDDEFVTAISDSEGISLDALSCPISDDVSSGKPEELDRSSVYDSPEHHNEDIIMPDVDFTSLDLNEDNTSSSSISSSPASPREHVVQVNPEELTICQAESNV